MGAGFAGDSGILSRGWARAAVRARGGAPRTGEKRAAPVFGAFLARGGRGFFY